MTNISTGAYSSWSTIQREKFRIIKQRLRAELYNRMFRGKLVLDVGCGGGFFQKEFKGDYIGVDIDEAMLHSFSGPRVLGDGNKLPFADYSFDTIISTDTMHLVKTKDFARVLKPGGIVLFSVFFNNETYDERRELLKSKLKDMIIVDEFTTDTKEKEYVVVAIKPTFR